MNPIVGQAVIVVTESPGGVFSIRSFGSPAGPSREAEEFCDRLAQLGHAVATMSEGEIPNRAGVDRLQRIEDAARAVLAHGQARYEGEEQWIGDLVPATVIQALRAAVNGDQERAQ